MNILCYCSKEYALEILKQIKVDNYYFVSNEEIPKVPNVFSYAYKPFYNGEFFSKYNWENTPPLNLKIIEDMMPYEPIILKMYERVGEQYVIYDKRRTDYLNHLRYWNHFLDKNKVNVYFRYYGPPHEGFDYIIYCLCKIKGISTYYSSYAFAPNFCYMSEDIKDPLFEIKTKYEINKNYYSNNEEEIKINPLIQKVVSDYWENKTPTYPPIVIPKSKKGIQKRRLKKYKEVLKYYNDNCCKPDFNKEYIYFPLQYQYEASTTPMSGVFNEWYLIVEILSMSGLPIYIKEHPRMSKNRSIEFFKKIINLPNVFFVAIEEDGGRLIDNALAVATTTGTSGWEALIKTKPVLMFGYNFYQYFDNVHKIDGVVDLVDTIKILKNSTKREVLIFLKSLEEFVYKRTAENIVLNLKKKILLEQN